MLKYKATLGYKFYLQTDSISQKCQSTVKDKRSNFLKKLWGY